MGPVPAVAAVRLAVRQALVDLPSGAVVLVACSGGADSMALAHAAAFEGPKRGLAVGGVTIDHGLQPGSADRARAVAKALRGMGLAPVEIVAVQVGRDGGPEAAARTARYAALERVADANGASAVLLGHTRDDQAETVLLGLARGSGARSLAGMASVSGRYRRPLLDVTRETTRAACEAVGLDVWDDPHNHDSRYARVRVRHDVLPVLEQALGPGVSQALARTAKLLREDADALDERAAEVGDLQVESLAALPTAVRRRVLKRAAIAAGVPAGRLAASHVLAIDALVTDWHGQGPIHLPGGVEVVRRYGTLFFRG
jgi:tRNA(Ile)-lysidine synthase